MEFLTVLRNRRSVREFKDASVAPEIINRLVDAAIHAPNAVNAQPWHFTVIRDRSLLDQISARSKAHMLAAVEAGSAPHGFREHLADPNFHVLHHAPVLIVISAAKTDAWMHEDAALAAENLMLAACAEGLGSCWIGFAQRWLETDEGRKRIDLPASYAPVAPIIVGYPSTLTAPPPRKPPPVNWIG